MQPILYDQLDRWLEIMILQKYTSTDELSFPFDSPDNFLISRERAKRKLRELIGMTCKRFKLSTNKANSKTDTKPFDDWHREMLTVFCCINYARTLCSLCPFSLGMEEMIIRQGAAPCVLLDEVKLFSFEPQGCIILTSGYWSEKFLVQKIVLSCGPGKATDFLGIKTCFCARFPD